MSPAEQVREASGQVPYPASCSEVGVAVGWDETLIDGTPGAYVDSWNTNPIRLAVASGDAWLADALRTDTVRIHLLFGAGDLRPLRVEQDPRCPLGPRYGRIPVRFNIVGDAGAWNTAGVGEIVVDTAYDEARWSLRRYHRPWTNLTPAVRTRIDQAWTAMLGEPVALDDLSIDPRWCESGPCLVVGATGHAGTKALVARVELPWTR